MPKHKQQAATITLPAERWVMLHNIILSSRFWDRSERTESCDVRAGLSLQEKTLGMLLDRTKLGCYSVGIKTKLWKDV